MTIVYNGFEEINSRLNMKISNEPSPVFCEKIGTTISVYFPQKIKMCSTVTMHIENATDLTLTFSHEMVKKCKWLCIPTTATVEKLVLTFLSENIQHTISIKSILQFPKPIFTVTHTTA